MSSNDVIAQVRAEVAQLHSELVRYQLVAWTAGNISARVPGEDLLVIKPSGVSYDELSADAMIVCDLDGERVEGELSPSSDTAAHAFVYREMPEVGGVVHTHSTYATAWAARGESVPCVLTAMADEFGGEIPVGPFALIGDDSIGRGIVDTLGQVPLAGRADGQPRRVHRRIVGGRRGQDRGHVRGRRPHRPHRSPARRAPPHPGRRRHPAVGPLPERVRPALKPQPAPRLHLEGQPCGSRLCSVPSG